jgi:hypothetical protein
MEKSDLLLQIENRVAADQEVRKASPVDAERMRQVDMENVSWLKSYFQEHAWPSISEIGADASNKLFFIAQHADHDLEFQEQVLSAMIALPDGEIKKSNIAYLTDRVRVAKNLPQVYGTQFEDFDDYVVLRTVENLDGLDVRRSAMGMEPIQEYLNSASEAFSIPAYLVRPTTTPAGD